MADGKDKAASCCGGEHSHGAHHGGHDHGAHSQDAAMAGAAAVAIAPVGGRKVGPKAPKGGRFTYKDSYYVFCSQRCHDRFAADPEKFLALYFFFNDSATC